MSLTSVERALIMIVAFSALTNFMIAAERGWAQELDQAARALEENAERIEHAPTPPPRYLRRRWEWMRAQGVTSLSRAPALEDLDDPDEPERAQELRDLQQRLWSLLGQAGQAPLYESPQERDQRRANMDLRTQGTPILPSYTHEFVPNISPHKRMTVWNRVSEAEQLEVEIGGLTEIENLAMPVARSCVSGRVSPTPSRARRLSLGDQLWITPEQLDLTCLRKRCLSIGAECFLGVFSLKGWSRRERPRGVASISPEQQLITIKGASALILSQDEASNFYLSAPRQPQLSILSEVVLPLSAPRSYFTGSWSSPHQRRPSPDHPELQLPDALRREALTISAQLGFDVRDSYEELIFKLTDWFRAFNPGDPPALKGSIYRQLTLSQTGVCRHRSYAFFVTARALGVPTRYVTNQVHAFVEVLDPFGRWRRVDLGGEGVAPESDELTQPTAEATDRSQVTFKPDDGLPQPEAYLEAMRRASQRQGQINEAQTAPKERLSSRDRVQGSSIADSSSGQRGNQGDNEEEGSDLTRPDSRLSERASSDSERANSERKRDGQRDQIAQDEIEPNEEARDRSASQRARVSEAQDQGRLGSAPQAEIEEVSRNIDASENRDPSDVDPSENTSSSQTSRDLNASERGEDACPYSPQPISMSDLRESPLDLDQARAGLLTLIEARETQPKRDSPKIKVRLRRGSKIHRCSWIELSGMVSQRGRPRYPPRGAWVFAALRSQTGDVTSDHPSGYQLHGWGRIGRRGRFSFKAQVPHAMRAGAYQLLVYFPQQRGWREGWSAVR